MLIESPPATFWVGSGDACLICQRLRDNHVRTSQCTWFESLTLKIEVKVVGWKSAVKVSYQHALLGLSVCSPVQSFVHRSSLLFTGPVVCSQYIIVYTSCYDNTAQLSWNGVQTINNQGSIIYCCNCYQRIQFYFCLFIYFRTSGYNIICKHW